MKYMDKSWIFDCPIHGFETQVFCFRAFDPLLAKNWSLYEIIYEELMVPDEEKQKFLDTFRKENK